MFADNCESRVVKRYFSSESGKGEKCLHHSGWRRDLYKTVGLKHFFCAWDKTYSTFYFNLHSAESTPYRIVPQDVCFSISPKINLVDIEKDLLKTAASKWSFVFPPYSFSVLNLESCSCLIV